MLIKDIPPHLRNTIQSLDLPIYLELEGDILRAPANLALGDTLMVLGVVRNLQRPVRLSLKTRFTELLCAHPQIGELIESGEPMRELNITSQPVARRGRRFSFGSSLQHHLDLPVLPVDRIAINPVLAHSLHYQLPSRDDRPGAFPDPARPFPLGGLLSPSKPGLIIYPFNPGRTAPFWQDEAWWAALLQRLRPDFHLIAVGADDYGPLAEMVDAALPQSDPASRLADLVRLFQACRGFVGRDGGLSHLACAAGARTITLWDSMSSYRFWASRAASNVVLSNPYGFRYPQTMRLTLDDLKASYRKLRLPAPDGSLREIELPLEGFKQKAREIFGDLDRYGYYIQELREEETEREGLQSWLNVPAQKEAFYAQSLDFVLNAISGRIRPGQNWVAPVSP